MKMRVHCIVNRKLIRSNFLKVIHIIMQIKDHSLWPRQCSECVDCVLEEGEGGLGDRLANVVIEKLIDRN